METPADNPGHPGPEAKRTPTGARAAEASTPRRDAGAPADRAPADRAPADRAPADGSYTRAIVLGSLTIPGRREQVGLARAFVAGTLRTNRVGADADAATLLTSEIVTNAILHTKSGVEGGTVTIVVIGVSRGVLVEIIDDGSAGAPVVKGDLYAAEGHGLFLVEHLAAKWGYLRDSAGTTVWFHLPATYEPQRDAGQPGLSANVLSERHPSHRARNPAGPGELGGWPP